MELQFSISELSSYLDEVFPQVVNQYKILALEPGYAKIVQIFHLKTFGLAEQLPVQPFLVL